jgi:hypothetical protein
MLHVLASTPRTDRLARLARELESRGVIAWDPATQVYRSRLSLPVDDDAVVDATTVARLLTTLHQRSSLVEASPNGTLYTPIA